MSTLHEPPSKVLRFFAVLIGEFVLIFSLVRLFGFLPGVVVALSLSYFLQPRESAGRAYASIVLGLLAAGGAGYSSYLSLNALRVWEGVETPSLSVKALDGQSFSLDDLRGKRVALNFWATWCGPCQAELPELSRLFKESGREDVLVIGVSNESEETIRTFLKDNPVDYPVAAIGDIDLPSPFSDVYAVPTTFVIDRKGIIQTVRAGFAAAEELQQMIWEADDYAGPIKPAPGDDS